MSSERLSIADYPLAEKRPDLVVGQRGKRLEDITLRAVTEGKVILEDIRITSAALHHQAEIARAADRLTLAQNFDRAAELVNVPQETIMRAYEMLRPGRATSKAELLVLADELRSRHSANLMAAFIEEAAEVYDLRGLLKQR